MVGALKVFGRSRFLDVLVLVFGVVYAGLVITPISHWYNVGEIAVHDTPFGSVPKIDYHGGAVRNFIGSYSVVIRDFSTRSIACEANSGKFTYEADSTRPDPLLMSWWAPGDRRCSALPIGSYIMETCWTVYTPFAGLVPAKTGCVSSMDFSVRPQRGPNPGS